MLTYSAAETVADRELCITVLELLDTARIMVLDVSAMFDPVNPPKVASPVQVIFLSKGITILRKTDSADKVDGSGTIF